MANALTNLNKEVWASKIQQNLHKMLVAMDITNMELRSQLSDGDTAHRPYIGTVSATNYTKGTDITFNDIDAYDETLIVNRTKVAPFYIDDIDKIQNSYASQAEFVDEATYSVKDVIDQAVLNEVLNAFDTVDAGDIVGDGSEGSAGTAITLDTTNAFETFSTIRKKLLANNVREAGDFYAVVNPAVASVIEQTALASGFNLADSTLKNGYAGDFAGFKIYVSNNLNDSSSRQHCLCGKKGNIDLVMQAMPQVNISDAEKRLGSYIKVWTLYGIKTFTKQTQKMIDLQVTNV